MKLTASSQPLQPAPWRRLLLGVPLAALCACSSSQSGEGIVPKPAFISSATLENGQPAFAIYHLKSLDGGLDEDVTPAAKPQPLAAGSYAATFRCMRIKSGMGGPAQMASAGRRQTFLFFVESGTSFTLDCDAQYLGQVTFTLNVDEHAGRDKTRPAARTDLSEADRALAARAIRAEIMKITDDAPLPRAGTNRVNIQGDASGRIYGGYLRRSSGFPWLDAETVAALARIHRFPFRQEAGKNEASIFLDCPTTFPLRRHIQGNNDET